MATPRSVLVDDQVPLYYHVTSRCVQQAWLLGYDPVTKRDYSHRREWLTNRLRHLATFFSVDVAAYAIMSNHFHLVVYLDPTAPRSWSDEEVARRWVSAFPPRVKGKVDPGMCELMQAEICEDEARLKNARSKLASLSCFMKHLKQPIAWRANQEVGTDGDFWANRFYSGALLDHDAVIAAMIYVDLNPVRAQIARSIEESVGTSVFERLHHAKHNQEKLEKYLQPITNLPDQDCSDLKWVKLSLDDYVMRLRAIAMNMQAGPVSSGRSTLSEPLRWLVNVRSLSKRQRAFGTKSALAGWLRARNLRPLEKPMG